MAYFKINDRHIAFSNAVAGGMTQWQAYQQTMCKGRKCGKQTAATNSTKLMRRKQIQDLIDRAKKVREEAILGVAARQLSSEFQILPLTADQMDSYHSAIIQGMVEVEEVVPTFIYREVIKNGLVVGKERVQNFVRVKRPANIREKQASIDALYKRGGHYAPSKLFGAFKNLDDDSQAENVVRTIMLSNGEKIPFNP